MERPVPLIGASFAELTGRNEYDGVVEGTAIVTGTWTGSVLLGCTKISLKVVAFPRPPA